MIKKNNNLFLEHFVSNLWFLNKMGCLKKKNSKGIFWIIFTSLIIPNPVSDERLTPRLQGINVKKKVKFEPSNPSTATEIFLIRRGNNENIYDLCLLTFMMVKYIMIYIVGLVCVLRRITHKNKHWQKMAVTIITIF